MANQQPLQAILIAPGKRERDKILAGKISATIRKGVRDYRVGDTLLCCHIDPWCVKVQVVGVVHMRLQSIPLSILVMAGYHNYFEALNGMRRFHPETNGGHYVTAIMWSDVEGKLADGFKRRSKKKLPKWLRK